MINWDRVAFELQELMVTCVLITTFPFWLTALACLFLLIKVGELLDAPEA